MRRTKEQAKKRTYEVGSSSRTQASVPPPVDNNARRTRVLRGLNREQLALADIYKSTRLIGGKYFDPSVLREFGCEYMVDRLLRHGQWSRVFDWRGPTYGPVTYEFLASLKKKKKGTDQLIKAINIIRSFWQEVHTLC